MASSGRTVEDQAWVTLATNDAYALGALVLGQSLQQVGTTRKLVVLITPGVTAAIRDLLSQDFDLVKEVNVLDSNDSANLALLTRPELGVTFTKLHCWRLTQFNRCVFMDADTLVLQNCDELFEREELSAVPDVGWPDCFNSGVFVFRPSDETYQALLQVAITVGSFDGGDQGLLNIFFSDWATSDISRHLSFIYNMTSSAVYSYLPAYQQFGKDVKVVHFLGPLKPWNNRFNAGTGQVEATPGAHHALEHLQTWWNIFVIHVHPRLQPDSVGLPGQLAQLTIHSLDQRALENRARQFQWEQGQIDYLGADSFDNIQKKLDQAISVEAAAAPAEAAPALTEAVPAPVEATPAPVVATPTPAEAAPAPVEATPAPVEATLAPVESAPAPVEAAPAPVEAAPAPVEAAPAPVEAAPVEAPAAPAPTSPEVLTVAVPKEVLSPAQLAEAALARVPIPLPGPESPSVAVDASLPSVPEPAAASVPAPAAEVSSPAAPAPAAEVHSVPTPDVVAAAPAVPAPDVIADAPAVPAAAVPAEAAVAPVSLAGAPGSPTEAAVPAAAEATSPFTLESSAAVPPAPASPAGAESQAAPAASQPPTKPAKGKSEGKGKKGKPKTPQ